MGVLPLDGARLIEPFAGGAALFFRTADRTSSAILGDSNASLVACYRALRNDVDAVAAALAELTIDRETYDRVAREVPETDIESAARLIYLNRTAFNGLWRVNRRGQFNVPYGCKPETILPRPAQLADAAQALSGATLVAGDFRRTLERVERASDVVYLDPPYTVAHDNNGFVRYNERIFHWRDQIDLASWANEAARSGRCVAVSNAAHDSVVRLYDKEAFHAFYVVRISNMAAASAKRGVAKELLLVSKSCGSRDVVRRRLKSSGILLSQRS